MLARLLYVAYAGCSYPNLIVPVQYIKGHCWRDSQRPFSAVTRGASPVFPKNAPDSAHHYTYICPMNTWLTISVFLLHTALSTIWSKVVAVVHRRQPERNFMRTSQVRCKSLGAPPCHSSRACGATVARSTPATGLHRKVVGSNPAGLIEEAISFYSLFCSFRFFPLLSDSSNNWMWWKRKRKKKTIFFLYILLRSDLEMEQGAVKPDPGWSCSVYGYTCNLIELCALGL